MAGWHGVDLDGTLAHDTGWHGPDHIGPPVPEMMDRVKAWLLNNECVKIMTARAGNPGELAAVREWLAKNGLPELEITDRKDKDMIDLWDDRAVEVIPNTGRPANPLRRLVATAQALPESTP
jgi:hypothetical protein